MIRTLIVDRHPALRAGVKVVLEAERRHGGGGRHRRAGGTPAAATAHPARRRAARLPPTDGRRPARMSPRQVPDSGTSGAHLLRVRRRAIARRGARRRRRRPARQELLGARPGSGDPRRPQRPPPARTHRTRRRAGCDAVARPPGSADPRDAARRRTAVRDRRRAEHASRDASGDESNDILGRLCAEPPWTAADIPCDRPAA